MIRGYAKGLDPLRRIPAPLWPVFEAEVGEDFAQALGRRNGGTQPLGGI
jgi:hypothetical protein